MDPRTLKRQDRISHPDFGEGVIVGPDFTHEEVGIEWDRQGFDSWRLDDSRWEQVLLA
jgi:hypothetical protein